ncbi:dicarboxylate/amino acid:cation symporter [Pseudonocardiaceae bacterium YIM PH 21723]|nr:dicarboxylate/amino acid:cation symporter [Pseudonocardiaceae bacterium YIM PH 21723]
MTSDLRQWGYVVSRRFPLALQVLAGLVLGVVLGLVARSTDAKWLAETLSIIATIFTNLLQVLVLPLVFTAIIVGISSLHGLGGPRTAARLGIKTVVGFASTSLIAVLIGIGVGALLRPGSGITVEATAANIAKVAKKKPGDWLTFLKDLVPENFFAALSEGNVLQVVLLALLIGAAAYALGEKAKPFVAVNQALFDIVQKIVSWVIKLAPIGVLGLLGNAFAQYGTQFVKPLFSLIVAVYLGCAIVLFVVYPILLRFVGGVSPLQFFAKSWNAIQFAFVSRSSGATLPLSRQAAVDLGVPQAYAGFAVPLGTTTKMDGCAAVYPAIATIFIANLFGQQLSVWQYVAIVATAVFGALATAGTTGWFSMLTITLSFSGIDPKIAAAGLAIVISIDPILDMMRTATNVAGQIAIPVVVAGTENLLGTDDGPSGEPELRAA